MNHPLIDKLNKLVDAVNIHKATKWISINEACNYCKLSKSTIRRAVKEGKLKASPATGKLLFNIQDIEEWLNG